MVARSRLDSWQFWVKIDLVCVEHCQIFCISYGEKELDNVAYRGSKCLNKSRTIFLHSSGATSLVSTSSRWLRTILSRVASFIKYVMQDIRGAIQKFELRD